ncbi:MAG: Trk system potassium transporter TrkA [Bacillota bacterium]|nr:Trk system potassium transporter TrkA [Bacillota bacterium]
MKSIIVGVGKVGYALASMLCAEGHQVTVIDNNRRRLDIAEETLDASIIEGNAAKIDVLNSAGIEDADLLAAVTEKDELNMLACFLAKSSGAKSTVARVRNPGYSDFNNSDRMDALGIDMLFNPDKVVAEEIVKLIGFPEAHFVGYFGNGKVQLLELKLHENCHNLDIPLLELDFPYPCIVIAIDRGGELIIPKGDAVLKAGDEVLFLAKTEHMRYLEEFLNIEQGASRNIVILGGSLTGYYLASMLDAQPRRFHVKLIESDYKRCEEMAYSLKHTIIVNSSGSNIQLYEDENIGVADIFIAVTEDDKENLFASVLAKSLGASKTIAQIRGSEFVHIVEQAGIDRAVSPSALTADAILRFLNRNRILSLTRFDQSMGQISELLIPEGAACAGVPLMKLNFPRRALVCMIIREDKHIIPQGADALQPGDTAIVFAMPEVLDEVEKLLLHTHEDNNAH